VVLAHRHRRTIYDKLSPILGDEETEAMLSHFPSTPGEEPVTVAVLDARLRQTENRMLELYAKTLTWIITALLGGLAIGMGVAAAVSQAVGG
jgi:hypothetical protein